MSLLLSPSANDRTAAVDLSAGSPDHADCAMRNDKRRANKNRWFFIERPFVWRGAARISRGVPSAICSLTVSLIPPSRLLQTANCRCDPCTIARHVGEYTGRYAWDLESHRGFSRRDDDRVVRLLYLRKSRLDHGRTLFPQGKPHRRVSPDPGNFRHRLRGTT